VKFKPVDWLNFAYLALVSVLVSLFHRHVEHWGLLILAFAGYALVILGLVWLEPRLRGRSWFLFLRHLYPLLAIPLLYESIEKYATLFHGRYLDAEMIAFEAAVFGGSPNLWLERLVTPLFTEYMMAAYFSYYLYSVLPPLLLFARRRYQDLDRFTFNLLLAFFVCYLGFLAVPLLGPIHVLKDHFTIPALTGYVFAPLQRFIMTHGDPLGTCFPSSHVAVAWVGLLSIRQAFGSRIFWILSPFTVSLTMAVFYNRYHYVTDAAAGLLTAFAVFWLASTLDKGRSAYVTPETASQADARLRWP